MNIDIKKKIVLLTGAGKGIGKQILNLLIKENVIVYAVTRDKKDFKNLKKSKNLYLINGDITRQDIINKIFSLAKRNIFCLDILIYRNNKHFNTIMGVISFFLVVFIIMPAGLLLFLAF